MLGQRHADRVDRFVPVEAFIHKSRERAPYWDFVPGRDLIFDHRMEDGVRRPVWQPNARPPVIFLDEPNALALVQRQPLFRCGGREGIVASHAEPLEDRSIAQIGSPEARRKPPIHGSERDFVRQSPVAQHLVRQELLPCGFVLDQVEIVSRQNKGKAAFAEPAPQLL
jgi:hypothetical protein